MARAMRGCLTAWLQQEGAAKSWNNVSILWLEEQADAKEGKVMVYYKPDINYEPEGSDPNDEPDAQGEEEEENSDVEYAKVEIPFQGTLRQKTMHYKVQDQIQHIHAE